MRSSKALITLEQVNTSEVEKKKNVNSAAYWSGVVAFHCMQMSLAISMRLIFGID